MTCGSMGTTNRRRQPLVHGGFGFSSWGSLWFDFGCGVGHGLRWFIYFVWSSFVIFGRYRRIDDGGGGGTAVVTS